MVWDQTRDGFAESFFSEAAYPLPRWGGDAFCACFDRDDRRKGNEDVNESYDNYGKEHCQWQVLAGIYGFVAGLGDDFVAFERDVGKAHRYQEAGPAFGHEGCEIGQAGWILYDGDDADYADGYDEDGLAHCDDGADLSGLGCAAIVDVQEYQGGDDGDDLYDVPLDGIGVIGTYGRVEKGVEPVEQTHL